MKAVERQGMPEGALELVAGRFGALAQPLRLRLLRELQAGEKTVTALIEATGAGQANVSRHLRVLMDARMVSRRRDGLKAYYRISDPAIFQLCDLVCRQIRADLEANAANFRRGRF